MGSAMPPKNEKSFRDRVLQVLDESLLPMTGAQVAHFTGLSYKQAIDALDALLDHGKVEREGRKFTAKWERARPKPTGVDSAQKMILIYMARPR